MRTVTLYQSSAIRPAVLTALMLLGTTAVAQAAKAPPPPPVSDGSSGSWSAQIGNGVYNSFNTDSGLVQGCNSTYCPYQTTLPFKTGTYNGKPVHIFNFTDMTVTSGNPAMIIYGSTPALFLASQGISIAIPMHFLNGGGAGGLNAPDTATAPGGNGGGKGGGFGGVGQAGETSGCGASIIFTASGGGGGGNHSPGLPGLPGVYPPAGAGTNPDYPPGPGGRQVRSSPSGGGGGAGGGGGNYGGDFYSTQGGAGGGAIVFGSSTTIDVTSTGNISTDGNPGEVQSASAGSGGGGAAGDAYFFASSSFSNEGFVNAQGGAGGADTFSTPTADCQGTETVPGPNGGNGAGASLVVSAPKITNTGTIDVADGGGSAANGGSVKFVGKVLQRGTIIGVR